MKRLFIFLFAFCIQSVSGQFHFSGQIDNQQWQSDVYLSLVEDYRKINGIYSEQIIARAKTDSLGHFLFSGNYLEPQNRLYRLHVDNCETNDQEVNHFSGSCPESQFLVFIAKNSDTITFPFSFEKEMFCSINSSNPINSAIVSIDSLREEMQYAFSEVRSEANRKLNSKKWFATFQEFGENLNDPLAEVYIYSNLSERSSELYDFYLEDLESNTYYDKLNERLISTYPETSYTKLFSTELAADKFSLTQDEERFDINKIVYILLIASVLLNMFWLFKVRSAKKNSLKTLESKLTQQERKILQHLLTDASNKDIAESLFVSLSTIKSHVNSIYRKYDVQSRDDLKSLFNK